MAQQKRKKRFYNVNMPLIKKTTQIRGYEIKDLDNKFIKYDLTRILKGKSATLTLKTKVNKEEVNTIPHELRLLPFYIKRMIRRGTNQIEDSFSTKTKDGKIIIKPLLVTRRKVSRAVRKALRNKAREELIEIAKDSTIEKFYEETLKNKIQKDLSLKLKKIYPLGVCDLRVLKTTKQE